MTHPTPENVVVVGGSYVGLNLAESLAASSQGRYRVLIIEKNSHFQHLFAFPRYAVTTSVETHKAFIPYQASRLGQDGAIIQAKAISLTPTTITLDREVTLDGETTARITYAALALATGTSLSPPSTLPSSSKQAGTTYLRKHAALITRSNSIAIIGGGAVGVQMATDIAELYPSKRVTLIHSRATLMNAFHPDLHALVAARCVELGIDLVLGRGRVQVPEQGFPTDGSMFAITFPDGASVQAECAVVATGQTPQSGLIATLSPESVTSKGFVKVLDTLQVACPSPSSSSHSSTSSTTTSNAPKTSPCFPNIFALGDIANTPAHKAARPALRQAEVVAANISALFSSSSSSSSISSSNDHTTIPMQKYEPTDPRAIHLTLGISKSVIFRNPAKESDAPVVMWKDDGRLDMGIDGVWKRRGVDLGMALL